MLAWLLVSRFDLLFYFLFKGNISTLIIKSFLQTDFISIFRPDFFPPNNRLEVYSGLSMIKDGMFLLIKENFPFGEDWANLNLSLSPFITGFGKARITKAYDIKDEVNDLSFHTSP